ncbi:MAG: hypothetical protein GWN00_11770, partial [Aliifodinibius sp.]|nr:hypothetical protein [Fodinibius sp.]NIV16724.1 hypothetical protein [Fodinibius sp.]NIY25458.1 hypothetical protein [Fodinibius sp.]
MSRIRSLLAAGLLAVVILALVLAAANSVTAKTGESVTQAQQGDNLVPAVPGTFLTGPNEGEPLAIAMNFLRENRAELKMSQVEVSNLIVKD